MTERETEKMEKKRKGERETGQKLDEDGDRERE
jgi:hypothetical protein